MYTKDKRIVITLDAGGTNFVFGAMRGGEFINPPITRQSHSDNLEKCLHAIVDGFKTVSNSLSEPPTAISFAFPGPADYPKGIIGGYLPNFPSFREGVALGPYLEDVFGIPVFINNDADLFAYGEALCGALPEINRRLMEVGSSKRFENLLGYTFGTGFGLGVVVNGELNRGDNSCVETFCLPHKLKKGIIAEEGVAARAIRRVYAEVSGDKNHSFEPKDICEIADGKRPGDKNAAKKAFEEFGEIAGDSMAVAAQLIDGIIVIGGGITAAKHLFMPSLLQEMRSDLSSLGGDRIRRVQMGVYNLDSPEEFEEFAAGHPRKLTIPGTDRTIEYDDMKRIGVTISKLGASKAISIGAYAYALSKIDSHD